jgi:hypothetical protein
MVRVGAQVCRKAADDADQTVSAGDGQARLAGGREFEICVERGPDDGGCIAAGRLDGRAKPVVQSLVEFDADASAVFAIRSSALSHERTIARIGVVVEGPCARARQGINGTFISRLRSGAGWNTQAS